jgi:nucleoside phosphorylase
MSPEDTSRVEGIFRAVYDAAKKRRPVESSRPSNLEAPVEPEDGLIRLKQAERSVSLSNTIAQPVTATSKMSEPIISAESNTTKKPEVDLVIVNALRRPEAEWTMKVLGEPWYDRTEEGILFHIGHMKLGNLDICVAIASPNEMGMVASAILTSKACHVWKPACIAMTGKCAGVKQRKVKQGDIIVAKSIFDYGSGKFSAGKLEPDYAPVEMNPEICSLLIDFATEDLCQEIWSASSIAAKPNEPIKPYVGALASGAAVVGDLRLVEQITSHKRSLLGIDMEAFGVAKAAIAASDTTFLVVKAVSDFGGIESHDEFGDFCSYASALFLRKFMELRADALFSGRRR